MTNDGSACAVGPDKVVYRTAVRSTEDGRSGLVQSEDGQLDLALALPKELGGSGVGTNPEQLFAAGYAACFHSSVKLIARQEGIPLAESSVTAQVAMGPRGNAYTLKVRLIVSLPGIEGTIAHRLAQAAKGVCPYSIATEGNIPFALETAS
jgi:osmotically inducible protein OsmC